MRRFLPISKAPPREVPDIQELLAAHITLCQEWQSWQKLTKELLDAGKVEKAREAYEQAQYWYSLMTELEAPYRAHSLAEHTSSH